MSGQITPQELMAAIAALTPEQRAQLQAATANGGRSPEMTPFNRQLHDMKIAPSATNPRPQFFWSATPPSSGLVGPGSLYPRLLWSARGDELTVYSAKEERDRVAEGYLLVAPVAPGQMDPLEALNALPAADREMILESLRRKRIGSLQAQLETLPPSLIESATAPPDTKRKSA
jgi:hypothetical protein